MRKPLHRASLVAQFPVAVVDGGDRAGAHDALEVVARKPSHFGNRLLQRHLDLGQRRDRHPHRQVVVQHVVLAHIGMGQHVVAQRLRVAQPGAVAEHHPGMRPQHRDMVGYRLGVGRPDADIDHRDAAVVRLFEMIGRHLWQARRRGARRGVAVAGQSDEVARFDERGVAAASVRHQGAGAGAELVDVELVVGEQHEILEMLRAGRRVMRHAMQRIIDALRGERRQRPRFAQSHFERAVGDLVVRAIEIRHVEQVADRPLDALGRGGVDIGAFEKGEVERDRGFRFRHRHHNAVIAHDEPQLFRQIGFEQVGARDRGGEVARGRHMAVGLP